VCASFCPVEPLISAHMIYVAITTNHKLALC